MAITSEEMRSIYEKNVKEKNLNLQPTYGKNPFQRIINGLIEEKLVRSIFPSGVQNNEYEITKWGEYTVNEMSPVIYRSGTFIIFYFSDNIKEMLIDFCNKFNISPTFANFEMIKTVDTFNQLRAPSRLLLFKTSKKTWKFDIGLIMGFRGIDSTFILYEVGDIDFIHLDNYNLIPSHIFHDGNDLEWQVPLLGELEKYGVLSKDDEFKLLM